MEVSFILAKYSYEFKKQVVEAYLGGEGGYKSLAKRFHISSKRLIESWVTNYRAFGNDGLKRSRQNKNYSFEEKIAIVETYLTTEISYQALAIQNAMTNPALIAKWVGDYRIAGPDALRPKQRGRKVTIKRKSLKHTKSEKIDTSEKHVRELEDENLKLRIENAYLKELRRLRLKEQALQKEKQGSSTVSEDHSD